MKIERFKASTVPPNNSFEKDLEVGLNRVFTQLFELFNNGITFGDNFSCHIETVTTEANVGDETTITHALNRIPSGFIILEQDKAAIIYKGPTAKTAREYTIVSDTPSVKVTVVIL